MRVDELKNKILQLAIQGKLVPQDPNDEPASVLLEKIKEEKEQLIKEKKIKKEKPLPEISEEEKAFEIPKGWEWCRLGNIFNIKSSKRVYEKDYVEIGVPFYRSKEIGVLSENKEVNTTYYISYELYNELKYKYGAPKQGDLLVTSVGTIGKCWISDGREFYYKDGNITQIENTCLVDMKYLKNFIYSICFFKQIGKTVTGTAYNALTIIKFKNILMPLPPLQEQKRIVAKIDELFSIIDKLGGNKEALSKNIDITRDKVLQLAIQGKLVPQDPDDEPASVLLEKIKKEKEQLIKEKKIKKEKPLPEISEEEKSFEIPKGWEWSYLENLIILATDYVANGSFRSLRENVNTSKEKDFALFVKTQDFANNFTKGLTYIDKKSYDFLLKSKLYGGELMLSNIGASIGKAFIIPKMNIPMSLAPNSIMVKCNNEILTYYLQNLILSSYGQNYLKELTSGTAMPKFNKTQLRRMIIPIPPLQEQERIVAKINEIMSYLDKLQDLIDGKSLEIEGIQVKEIALSKDEELLQK